MQVQTDYNPQVLKLNCSSIASSTPGNNVSFPEGQLIKFQQFNKQQNSKTDRISVGHKKKLTIQINDSYDFNSSTVNNTQCDIDPVSSITQKNQTSMHFFKKNDKNQQSYNYCIYDSQSPSFAQSSSQIDFQKILESNMKLQQRLKKQQRQNEKLKQNLSQKNSEIQKLKDDNENMRTNIKKKQDLVILQKQRNVKLCEKIAQLEQQKLQQKFYDQKQRQKQLKIQQLQRKLEKITVMNKAFQKQLKQSDKKILELQKDLQKTFCQNQHDALNRIKESSIKMKQSVLKSRELMANKQNQNHNIMTNTATNLCGNLVVNTNGSTIQMRKSIEKKKCSQSQGKKKQNLTGTIKGQRTSSSSNIVTKKLLIKKQ